MNETVKKRILIVEDESVTALLLEQQLELFGFEVVSTESTGEEAIETALKSRPDIILMDVILSGELDGIASAERILEYMDIPIIYLTANSDKTTVERAKATGPFGYLLKPFEETELKVAVEIASYKHEMEKKLKQSEARFRALVQNASDIITVLDFSGYVLYQSPSFYKLLGYTEEEVAKQPYTQFIHPEDVDKVQEILQGISHHKNVKFEYRLQQKDGGYLWIETLANNMLENPAIQGIVANSRNITERKIVEKQVKDALKQKEVLLKEVYHRVKNNLAMIEGFMTLQKQMTQDQELRKVFENLKRRIHSMAIIHRNLYQSHTLDKIDLSSYLEELVRHISKSFRYEEEQVKLQLKVAPVSFDLNKSIAIGLITNELVTNCFKYGLPQNEPGRITIEFTNSDTSYQLKIKDNGKGFSDAKSERKTLGIKLINMLTQDLNGEMDVFNDNGACVTIKF
ncbi:PAS domain S-box protein [Rapidithrix thailandica]|uniref:histidine kinase n=1 Tax=Rapidithrix thailandica TaxID=413964 RepID=A0AAW9S2D9_9BACT